MVLVDEAWPDYCYLVGCGRSFAMIVLTGRYAVGINVSFVVAVPSVRDMKTDMDLTTSYHDCFLKSSTFVSLLSLTPGL
jgi:hypothetical protein